MKATSYSSKLSSFFVDSYNHPGKEHHSDHSIITDYPSKIRQPKKSITVGEQTRFKKNHGSWQFIFIYHISVQQVS